MDYAISYSLEPKKTRSIKDRRISQTLTKNHIIDLSNEGSSSQRSEVSEWAELKHIEPIRSALPELHKKLESAIADVMKTKSTPFKRYMKAIHYQQQCPEEALYLYKILTSVVDAFYSNSFIFDLSCVPGPSEFDLNNKLWGSIIEALFLNSGIKVMGGDTVLREIGNSYKINYRLCTVITGKLVDISNIEVGKGPTTTKVKDDHKKIVLEAKAIISRIVGPFFFIKPSSFAVPSLQICRLKADFIMTSLESPNKFVTRRFCDRIRAPLQAGDVDQMKKFMKRLVLYKEQVENLVCLIKKEVNRALDRRNSFERALGPSYKKDIPCYHHWLNKNKKD